MRAILSTFLFLFWTLLGSIMALCVWPFERTGGAVLWLARIWSRLIVSGSGIKLEVEGSGGLDPAGTYVFMANHQSTADVWAALVAVPVDFRFIAKKQLATIPVFGWAMRAGRFIFIDRQNAAAARRSIEEAERRIRGGTSVLLFPEGTRTRDGHLQEFKKGGFHLAIAAGVPVVPVAITGTRAVMRRMNPLIHSGHVRVRFGTPVPTAGLRDSERGRVLEIVRDDIVSMLRGMGAEPDPLPAAGVAQPGRQ